jgi:hypothetical protein
LKKKKKREKKDARFEPPRTHTMSEGAAASSSASASALQSQLQHLQMKYVGTGHADTSKHEWLVN